MNIYIFIYMFLKIEIRRQRTTVLYITQIHTQDILKEI